MSVSVFMHLYTKENNERSTCVEKSLQTTQSTCTFNKRSKSTNPHNSRICDRNWLKFAVQQCKRLIKFIMAMMGTQRVWAKRE